MQKAVSYHETIKRNGKEISKPQKLNGFIPFILQQTAGKLENNKWLELIFPGIEIEQKRNAGLLQVCDQADLL